MIFYFDTERELQDYIINHFNMFFPFRFISQNIPLNSTNKRNCNTIDIIGQDDNTTYIIELKRDIILPSTMKQLKNYVAQYQSLFPTEKVVGIAAAPEIRNDVKTTETLKAQKLKDVYCNIIKVTLYLDPDIWKRFRILAVERDRDYSGLVTEALDEYLKQHDPQAMRPRGK